jgi:hypothetical protein
MSTQLLSPFRYGLFKFYPAESKRIAPINGNQHTVKFAGSPWESKECFAGIPMVTLDIERLSIK